MIDSQTGYVEQQVDERGIATITFFHPAHNSLPGEILSSLADTITSAGENPAVKVIVLKSGGDRTFCAGASFDELIDSLGTWPSSFAFGTQQIAHRKVGPA